jgi:LmbE family N-acetylglucosaminyl deacetylase
MQKLQIPDVREKSGLIVIAHADDLLLFCGAATLALVDSGWVIHVVRVTDDCLDSWGLSAVATKSANSREFNGALAQLGITNIINLGYPTDQLGDSSEVNLRNQLVEIIREVRPYLVMTFDPDSVRFEDNLDHLQVASATNEACWTSGFDKHPDGEVDQLKPHLPIERWYFGRTVFETTHQLRLDVYRERLINAISQHKTMLLNMVAQLEIQARFLGCTVEKLQKKVEADPKTFAELLLKDRELENYRVIGSEKLQAVIREYGERL